MNSHSILEELKQKLPDELLVLLNERDGGAKLLEQLPKAFPPEVISTPTDQQRAWELTGLYFRDQGRIYESLSLMSSLYDQMLLWQEKSKKRTHKGMPLVWMSDLYLILGFPVHAKRYLMLTLCEDAIREQGIISPNITGTYFRLVWQHGLSDSDLKRYAREVYEKATDNPIDSLFPEWLLQEIDNDWMIELPSPVESGVYTVNKLYIRKLVSNLGERSGLILERLADYILSCMPGCRTNRRLKSGSSEYDIVCSMDGFDVDFRSELGRYFVCECKDWKEPANFTTLAKFCRVLDSTKSRFGILFSKKGVSGFGKTQFAEREQLKVFQDRGMVIVVIDEKDVESVAAGGNFISLLRSRYERVRLDLVSGETAK